MSEKNPIYNPFSNDGSIDPITGLTEKPSKNPIDINSLRVASLSTVVGPQDIGNYFETKSKYDTNITRSDLSDLERERALKQPIGAKAFNAVVGGISSGVLTAIEDIGYILDFEDHINRMKGLDHITSNFLSDTMKQAKQGLETGMPIHRLSNDVFDFSDPGFYFSSLKGILDSAVGFAIPGMAASKGIGALQKLARTTTFLNKLRASKTTANIINSLASGFITNYGEGHMMALEQFDNSVAQMKSNLFEDTLKDLKEKHPDYSNDQLVGMASELTEQQLSNGKLKDFEDIAGDEAEKFINRNRIFMLTDAIGLHGIMKGQGYTRGLLKEKGLTAWAKRFGELSSDNLLLQGGKEGLEEIGQNVLQMEGEYQSAKKAGQDVSETPEEFFDRALTFATSDKALLEGMMGVLGGGPQRILTEAITGNLGKKSKDDYQRRYKEQQDQIKANTDFLNAKLGNYVKSQALRANAVQKGMDNAEEIVKNAEVVELFRENFEKGTTENIERQLQDIVEGVSEEQRIANGWDENYQEQAKEQLKLLKELETKYNTYTKYENQGSVFENRQKRSDLIPYKTALQAKIEEYDEILETQEEGYKDPDIIEKRNWTEKQLSILNEHIKELDNNFKILTSAKKQQDIRNARKEIKKNADELLERAREKVIKNAQKQQTNDRVEQNNKKETVEKELVEEELDNVVEDSDISALSDVEDDKVDINQINKDDDILDDGIDIDQINPDELTAEFEKDKKSQERFNSLSDELVDDLTTSLIPESIAPGQEQDADFRRLSILKEMIKEAKSLKRSQDLSFDEFINALLKRHGSKKIAPIFNPLQGVWSMTNPKYTFYPDFDSYLKRSSDGQKELNEKKKLSSAKVNEQYTNDTALSADEAANEIENDLKQNNDPVTYVTAEYLKVEEGSGILAYLSRTYDQIRNLFYGQRKDNTNSLNKNMQDSWILDPEKYPVGTELILRVEDDDNIDVYIDPLNKIIKKWGFKKDLWRTSTVQGVKEKFDQLYMEEVPIGVYANGKKIGYLHEVSWINPENVHGNVEKDQERSRKIREHIVRVKEYKSKITRRTKGYLSKVANKTPIVTSEAIPDESLPIVTCKNGKLYTSRNELLSGNFVNKSPFKEGLTYIIVPISSEEKMAFPLVNNKIEGTPTIAKTIIKVLDIFYKQDMSNKEDKAIADEIFKQTKLNIYQNTGVSDYIKMFVHNTNVGDGVLNLEEYLADNVTEKQTNDVFMATFKRSDNDLEFEIARGRGIGPEGKPITFSRASIKKMSKEKYNKMMEDVERYLNKMYFNVDLDALGDDSKSIVLVNQDNQSTVLPYKTLIRNNTKSYFLGHNIAEEGQSPKYVYTIQPVITMDFSDIEGVDKETGKPVSEEKKETEMEVDPVWREIREIILNDKYLTPEEKKQAQTYAKKLFEVGKTREEVVSKLNEKYGLNIKETKIQIEDKKPKYNTNYEGDMTFGQEYSESLMPSSIVALGEDQVKGIKEKAEVTLVADGVVTGVIITDLGSASKQEQITDYLRGKLIDETFRRKGKTVNKKKFFNKLKQQFENNLKILKDNLAEAQKFEDEYSINLFQRDIANVEVIIKKWGEIEGLALKEIERIDNIKIIRANEEETEEENDQTNETAHFADAAAFTTPPTDRVAREVKQFLSGIGKYKEDPNNKGTFIPDLNYFGSQKLMDFWDVYNILQRITPNLDPSFDEIMAVLEKYKDSFPFMREIIVKLQNGSNQIKNQFTVAMTNHYVDMKFMVFGRKDDGSWTLVEHDSDANAIERVVRAEWYSNMIDRSGIMPINAPEDRIFDPDKVVALQAQFDKFKKGEFTEDELAEWLYEVGIELTQSTWNDIMSGNFEIKGQKQPTINLIKNSNGFFNIIMDSIKKMKDKSLINSDTFFDKDTAIKALSYYDAKYRSNSYSNSHKSGLKTVYSFSLNKFMINRLRELKAKNPEGKIPLVEALMELGFNGASSWLNQLASENPAFIENFDHWTVSLEALKKQGAKSKDNRELDKISEAEIELVKIGMLHSKREDLSGKNRRVIRILYPTTSDKTTAMGLRVLAESLSLDMEGNIQKESIDKIVDFCIRPEIQRIEIYQNKKSKGEQGDIKGYNDGAEQFIMFPEINTLKWIDKTTGKVQTVFNPDRSLNPNIRTEEAMDEIRKLVKSHFNNLVEKKLEFWRNNNIGTSSQKEKHHFLDADFLNGTTAKGDNPVGNVLEKDKTKAAAADMVFQYLIANAEISKTFTGDIALYYKQHPNNKEKSKSSEEYDFIADAKETYDNYNKRLAADIAPGTELARQGTGIYNQAILKDSSSASLARFEITEILDGKEAADKARAAWAEFQKDSSKEEEFKKSIKGLISEKYYSFDGTDAQEYTTWQEHLYVMRQLGEITDQEYNDAHFAISMGNDLSDELMGKVMQPMKPVYVDNIIDARANVERRIYIKTSSFPLLPQLTRGLNLDKLRIAMERQDIQRAVFTTGIKIGGITEPVNIWNEDGSIKHFDDIKFDNSKLQLNRKGFRIQQKVPYHEDKVSINNVTQAKKNLFVNILDVEGFSVPWHEEGKSISGSKLQELYNEKYERLHVIEREKLYKEIGFNKQTGKITDVYSLRKILIDEARSRNYPLSDQELLELDKELKFLSFSPSANKYESLLCSIINNRIIKIKFPGNSFILGSQEGFTGTKLTSEQAKDKINRTSGIVFTKEYDPKVGLKPAREENGVRKPSQAIVPWKFKTMNKNGKLENVSISRYIDPKTNMLDLNKVPPEVLQIFGMRIPNQGPNSQSWIEIVGFLPEASGDLIVASRDFVVQMGSDFDVDKLYGYMYSYYFDNEGNIKVHREVKKHNESEVIKNQIIDVHLAIHKNPDQRVQEQIVTPLDVWELGNISKEVSNLRSERERIENEKSGKQTFFTGLSDDYQRDKFKNATAGKAGVGVFSLDSMFNAIVQGKELTLMKDSKDVFNLKLGNNPESNGDLSGKYTLDGKTYKSSVIAGYQSAAVDNAKDPILEKLNINSSTFKVIKLLNQLGFGKEVPLITAQDIIIDYVKELERRSSSMAEFNRDKENAAYEAVKEKYNKAGYNPEIHTYLAREEATVENLKKYIQLGESAPNYHNAQIAILDLFRMLDGYGKQIQKVQSSVVNLDRVGTGKSVMESMIREERLYELTSETGPHIHNASKLIGDVRVFGGLNADEEKEYEDRGFIIKRKNGLVYAIKPETISGFAMVYGIITANELWSKFFPYNKNAVEKIFEKIEQLTRSSENLTVQKAERRKDIWNNLKSFLYTKKVLGLYDTDITTERKRLLFDVFEQVQEYDEKEGVMIHRSKRVNESLGTFLKRFKNTPFAKNNPFISKLTIERKAGEPTLIKYNASAAENIDETNIYSAIVDMLTKTENGVSPTVGEFNGRQITLQELAQELILYTYITGGIQEAVQFVKYIPASYLTTIPFAEELGNTAFLDGDFGIESHDDPVLNYYTVPPFVEQYIQHNPEKVAQVSTNDIQKADSKLPTHFTLKQDTLERVGQSVKGVDELIPPVYITISNLESPKKMNLYKFNLVNDRYEQIDTLGSFANEEYNAHTPHQISLIKANKAKKLAKPIVKEELTGNPIGDTITKEPIPNSKKSNSIVDSLMNGTVKKGTVKNGKEAIKEMLHDIMRNSNNSYFKYLAQELYNELDQLPESVSVMYLGNEIGVSTSGLYALGENGYNIPPHTLALNVDFLKHTSNEVQDSSRELVEDTILHELIHGLTGYKVALWVGTYAKVDAESLKMLKEIKKSVPDLELTNREIEIIKSINTLYLHAKNKVLSDPEMKKAHDAFQSKIEKRNAGDKTIKFTKKEIGMFYGFSNLLEFVSVAMTNPEFQAILNEIKAPSGKTLLQSLKEKLVKLLKAITGMNFKEGSVLEQTVYDVLDLINKDKVTETKPVQEKKVIEQEQFPKDNQLKLQDGRIITFNDAQSEALQAMRDWINSDESFFVLSGFAGTGKTTIVRKLVEENEKGLLKKNNPYPIKIKGAAPTHKAKRMLSILTGSNAITLHKLLGLLPNTDLDSFDAKNVQFDPKKESILEDYDLIIIDESSMINSDLFKFTTTLAKQFGTKILFMGDPGQIPPVGEVESQAFISPEITKKAHLTEVKRTTTGNPLGKVYDDIRSDLKSPVDKFSHDTKTNERGEGIMFTNDSKDFGSRAMQIFASEEYANNPNTAKIIAWSNERVGQFNKSVRRHLIGDEQSTAIIESGDVIMGYDTITAGYKGDTIIENSGDYKVIKRSELTTNKYGLKGYKATIVDTNDIEQYNQAESDSWEKRMLERVIFVLDSNDEENFKKFYDKAVELFKTAMSYPKYSKERSKAFAVLYQFRDAALSFKDIVYTNAEGKETTAIKKSIDYGYAITAHKAQGATYKHVFVDEDNIDKNVWSQKKHVTDRIKEGKKPMTKEDVVKEKNQIKYVALSRASHTATVLSEKTRASKNTYAQPVKVKEVKEMTEEEKDRAAEKWHEEEMDRQMRAAENRMNEDGGMPDPDWANDNYMPDLGDEDAYSGDAFGGADNPIPESIVPDVEVEEFMKHCKS